MIPLIVWEDCIRKKIGIKDTDDYLLTLVGNDYSNLKLFAIIVTIFICGVGLYLIMSEKVKIISLEDYLRVATWFMWTCILFLPSMHERYTYPLDIFLILLCFINREYLKYAIYSICLSTITYSSFLFANTSIDILMVLLYIFLYVYLWFLC